MTIQVETLKFAYGLVIAATMEAAGKRAFRVTINEHGLMFQGVVPKLPKIMRFEQTVSWRDLESPAAKITLENTFRRIEDAVAKLESDDVETSSAERSKAAK